ncbi:MAG: substrate-binding domain-containing protein [Deltaproteobacteria bacterium]|nr:substrate-binding domain-containing protein [Deltaproteobacteria bacterium]
MKLKGFRLDTFSRRFWSTLAAWILLAAPVFGETLTIPGTGACEPVLAELAAAFNRGNPEDQVTVPPSTGSGGGISSVLNEEASLARVARRLKTEEERQGLVSIVFARDAVAFVVGRQVKVSNLSASQLEAIFSGKIDNWKDVGGQEGKIRVITREPGDSSLIVIQEHLKGFRNIVFAPNAKVILFDRAAVETLDKYKNAIGFITTSSAKWSKGGIRPISLDGVAPARENVLSRKYRLTEEYALIYKKNLKPADRKFIDFVFSGEGRKVIEGNGLIALDRR